MEENRERGQYGLTRIRRDWLFHRHGSDLAIGGEPLKCLSDTVLD